MRVVLLTGDSFAHRYVADRISQSFGSERVVVIRSAGLTFRRKVSRTLRKHGLTATLAFAAGRVFARIVRRSRDATWRPAAPWPENTVEVSSHNGTATRRLLSDAEPDVVLVFGTAILGRATLAATQAPVVNLHTGLSPDYRGADCVFWALHNREPKSVGVTVHVVDEGVDTGPILARRTVPVSSDTDPDTAFASCVVAGSELLVQQASALAAGKVTPHPQDLSLGREYRSVDRTLGAEIRLYLRRLCRGRRVS